MLLPADQGGCTHSVRGIDRQRSEGGHSDKLNREFRRRITVGVAVEDMRHGVEVQIAGTGEDTGERPPQHRSGERLVAGERLGIRLPRGFGNLGNDLQGGGIQPAADGEGLARVFTVIEEVGLGT